MKKKIVMFEEMTGTFIEKEVEEEDFWKKWNDGNEEIVERVQWTPPLSDEIRRELWGK